MSPGERDSSTVILMLSHILFYEKARVIRQCWCKRLGGLKHAYLNTMCMHVEINALNFVCTLKYKSTRLGILFAFNNDIEQMKHVFILSWFIKGSICSWWGCLYATIVLRLTAMFDRCIQPQLICMHLVFLI